LDTSKGSNQQWNDLQKVTEAGYVFQYRWDFGSSVDGTQLFVSQCKGCGTGTEFNGPSTITVQSATGGPQQTILTSQNMALTAVRSISQTTLLLLVNNYGSGTNVDTSQNGLWK